MKVALLEKLSELEAEKKQQQYNSLLTRIRGIIYNEDNLINNLTNIAAILHHGMAFTWTGFYFTRDQALVLGPFLGPATRPQTPANKSACGIAYTNECTIIVDDVEHIPKHIPSGEFERSEIVVPAFKKGEVALLFNIVSNQVKNFDETDRKNLQQVIHLIEEIL